MKKTIVLILLILPTIVFAQSVAINTDASLPNGSAILDIKSDSKGLLTPRLTTLQRTSIASPATGLTVFDLDTYSYWMYRGILNGGWAELQHNFQNQWDQSGSHIYNKNNGNVGIGTNTPASKLTVNGIDPVISIMNNGLSNSYIQADGVNMRISTGIDNVSGKLLLGTKGNNHMAIDEFGRVSIGTTSSFDAEFKLNMNGGSPRFAFMQNDAAIAFLRPWANGLKLGTYPGNNGSIVFSPKNVDKVWIDEDGLVGIGTSTPVSALTINGSNPYIQIQNSGVNKGFFQVVSNDLRIGTNSTNTTGNLVLQTKLLDRLTINENGQVGIGTGSPSSILTVNGTNPILQLRNDEVDKGFVQLVNDDMRIGVNSANTNGRLIVRSNGTDRVWFHNNGKVSMGVSATSSAQLAIGNDFGTAGINFFNDNTNTFNIYSFGGNAWVETFTDQLILRAGTGASLYLKNNGQATIGLVSPALNHRLTVLGKIMCADVTTSPVYDWPDYVFGDDYKLRPIQELRNFVQQNKHLPNIPSATEIEKNGVLLGDMSKRLIEKVEELTLYVLQLQEQIDELKKQVQAKSEK